MTFANSITTCLSKYGIFKGRATRSEYWWFFLAISLPDCITLFVEHSAYEVLVYIYLLFSLAVLVPWIAVGSRRLHDVGKSGWWQLLWVVPIIGWIFIIYWSAKEGDNEENKFGVPPTIEEQPIAEAAGKAKYEAEAAEPATESEPELYKGYKIGLVTGGYEVDGKAGKVFKTERAAKAYVDLISAT